MTRSILWTSSRGPSPPFWMACGALPQPRSRMALAADTRAAAVASFDRITPTRTLSAVLVWLRASERISVRDLAIWACTHNQDWAAAATMSGAKPHETGGANDKRKRGVAASRAGDLPWRNRRSAGDGYDGRRRRGVSCRFASRPNARAQEGVRRKKQGGHDQSYTWRLEATRRTHTQRRWLRRLCPVVSGGGR